MSENECPYKQDVYCNKAVSNIMYCNYNFDEHCKPYKPPVITNADRIRSMSDKELMVLLREYNGAFRWCKKCPENFAGFKRDTDLCDSCAMKWLQQPYKEADR